MDPALTYEWVQGDLKVDPLKPNRLTRQVEKAHKKFQRHVEALREIAQG